MNKIELLTRALEYIELNLENELHTEEIARYCYCSKSTLEKLFRCINHISVHDYIVRRRMMKAARRLLEQPETDILSLAVRYGYGSNEAFTRAFRQVWNCNPSEFRRRTRFSEVYPRLDQPLEEGENMGIKHFDISELYDIFVQRRGCYFICCDIKNLLLLNERSRKAGDLAILETLKRLETAAGENDIAFRIGGDEFVLLTDTEEEAQAREIAARLAAYNGQCFRFEEQEIPLELHIGLMRFADTGHSVKYNELFTGLHEVCSRR